MANRVREQISKQVTARLFLIAALFIALTTDDIARSAPRYYAAAKTAGLAEALRDIEYARVGNKSLKLDLYVPDGAGPFPVIVWVHGGGWTSGDKALSASGPQVRQTARGYAVASINYRFSQEAKFPAQIEDCKAAVRWLRAHAAEHNLDPARIAVWGDSAGGHLASLMGASGGASDLEGDEGNLDYSSRVEAVVDWFGPSTCSKCLPIRFRSLATFSIMIRLFLLSHS